MDDVVGNGGMEGEEALRSGLSHDDMEWFEAKRRYGKKKKKDVSVPEPRRVEVSNKFKVFSEVEGEGSSDDGSDIHEGGITRNIEECRVSE